MLETKRETRDSGCVQYKNPLPLFTRKQQRAFLKQKSNGNYMNYFPSKSLENLS
jgi:hypothetical protein